MPNRHENHDLPEVYAKEILELLRWDTKVRNLASRKYEGEIKSGVVNVPVRDGEVVIQEYDVVNGATYTESSTSYEQIVADTDLALLERIDGFTVQALKDDVKHQRLVSGAYSLAFALEAKFINTLMNATGANVNGTALTETTAYKQLQTEIIALKRKKLLVTDIKILVSPELQGLLLLDKNYTNTASSLGTEAVKSGVVGKIHGVEVLEIPYLPAGVNYIAFAPKFTFAGEVFGINPNFDNMPLPHIGSSALSGRLKPYQKVFRGELIHIGGTVTNMDTGVQTKAAKAKVEQTPTK